MTPHHRRPGPSYFSRFLSLSLSLSLLLFVQECKSCIPTDLSNLISVVLYPSLVVSVCRILLTTKDHGRLGYNTGQKHGRSSASWSKLVPPFSRQKRNTEAASYSKTMVTTYQTTRCPGNQKSKFPPPWKPFHPESHPQNYNMYFHHVIKCSHVRVNDSASLLL